MRGRSPCRPTYFWDGTAPVPPTLCAVALREFLPGLALGRGLRRRICLRRRGSRFGFRLGGRRRGGFRSAALCFPRDLDEGHLQIRDRIAEHGGLFVG